MSSFSPFKELKIIDLSTVLAGPSVGSFFAELGAEVLKIENPNHPDITREWKLPTEEKTSPISAYFSSVNNKKHYRQLNLKQPEGRNTLGELVQKADIVLMNYKVGDQQKLGISDTFFRTHNPGLIIGKINGFGTDSNRPAYDLILQAETGFMAMNGTPESGPVKMPIALIDVLAAHHLKEGLLTELLVKAQQKDYRGRSISVSLYEAAVSSLVNQASNYLMNDFVPPRMGSLHPNIAPYGELFTTSDGKTITFAIGTNTHFDKLCQFLKCPELTTDKKYASVQSRVKHRESLYKKLYPVVKEYESTRIFQAMREKAVPCGEVKDLKAVFSTPQAQCLVRTEKIDDHLTKGVSTTVFKRDED